MTALRLPFALLILAACSRAPDGKLATQPATEAAVPQTTQTGSVSRPRVVAIGLGRRHSCALTADGAVRCWGLSADGRLGTGTGVPTLAAAGAANTPAVVALGGKAVAISIGSDHSCALLESRQVRCWGLGTRGQLGYGNADSIGDDETPATVGDVPLDNYATSISAAGDVTCAVIGPSPEAVRCWGANDNGELGYGTQQYGQLGDDESIKTVMPLELPKPVAQLAFPCARHGDDTVTCWGPDGVAAEPRLTSVAKLNFAAVGCVITTSKTARCWNLGAALGYGEPVISAGKGNEPDLVELPFVDVVQVAVAVDHGCVLLEGGVVRCWGEQQSGMLATADGAFVLSKDAVAIDLGVAATAIAVTTGRSCAITVSGGLRCWGYGKGGLLGYGNDENVGQTRAPSVVGDVPF